MGCLNLGVNDKSDGYMLFEMMKIGSRNLNHRIYNFDPYVSGQGQSYTSFPVFMWKIYGISLKLYSEAVEIFDFYYRISLSSNPWYTIREILGSMRLVVMPIILKLRELMPFEKRYLSECISEEKRK